MPAWLSRADSPDIPDKPDEPYRPDEPDKLDRQGLLDVMKRSLNIKDARNEERLHSSGAKRAGANVQTAGFLIEAEAACLANE